MINWRYYGNASELPINHWKQSVPKFNYRKDGIDSIFYLLTKVNIFIVIYRLRFFFGLFASKFSDIGYAQRRILISNRIFTVYRRSPQSVQILL